MSTLPAAVLFLTGGITTLFNANFILTSFVERLFMAVAFVWLFGTVFVPVSDYTMIVDYFLITLLGGFSAWLLIKIVIGVNAPLQKYYSFRSYGLGLFTLVSIYSCVFFIIPWTPLNWKFLIVGVCVIGIIITYGTVQYFWVSSKYEWKRKTDQIDQEVAKVVFVIFGGYDVWKVPTHVLAWIIYSCLWVAFACSGQYIVNFPALENSEINTQYITGGFLIVFAGIVWLIRAIRRNWITGSFYGIFTSCRLSKPKAGEEEQTEEEKTALLAEEDPGEQLDDGEENAEEEEEEIDDEEAFFEEETPFEKDK